MTHLNEIDMGYFEHLKRAGFNAIRLFCASLILLVHGLLPFILVDTASKLVDKVRSSFPKSKRDRILVRFNTKWKEDPSSRQWRVLVNGTETLAHKESMKTDCETIKEQVEGEQKFHFMCLGKVTWQDTNAVIS